MKHSHLLLLLPALLLCLPATGAELDDATRLQRMLSLAERSNGVYSVLEAAEAGDSKVLAARLEEGADPNMVDELGNTPLHLAVRGKSSKVVQMLLSAGADPQAVDAAGKTPRELCRHKKMQKMLEAGAKRRERELEADAMAKSGDCRGLQQAIKGGVNPNARSADRKGTLLLTAILAGQPEALHTLLALGARADACQEGSGSSALHLAAQRGSGEMVTALLKAGADPMKKSGNGATALHDAVWNNRTESITALLPAYKQVNYSPDGAHNGFPINMAISRNRPQIVRLFLQNGLNPNDKALCKAPPLIIAAKQGRKECAQLLLDAGADKAACDEAGKMAADYAGPELKALLR